MGTGDLRDLNRVLVKDLLYFIYFSFPPLPPSSARKEGPAGKDICTLADITSVTVPTFPLSSLGFGLGSLVKRDGWGPLFSPLVYLAQMDRRSKI